MRGVGVERRELGGVTQRRMGRGGESGDRRRSRERRSTLVFFRPIKNQGKRKKRGRSGDLAVFYANHMLI